MMTDVKKNLNTNNFKINIYSSLYPEPNILSGLIFYHYRRNCKSQYF